ncbi:MAG: polysaccharide deacetylase family protein [Bryobacteraceae bacterium]|jgi:peptidoglycan/xylan/chitin deacetylase (PgdA/CDA1 family)
MVAAIILLIVAVAVALMAWAVRGRSAPLLGSFAWRGPKTRRAVALTFDDGPSESTPRVLELLERHGAKATFFMCGHHVRRLPHVARQVAREGHEIANHTDTHEALYLRPPGFILEQIARAQTSIEEVTGLAPHLFRAPLGVRWFGMRDALKILGLTGVMWTEIARDWTLDGAAVARRLDSRAVPGAILCFHDGRELRHNPDIGSTLEALELLLPRWAGAGYEFLTVSELLWQSTTTSHSA